MPAFILRQSIGSSALRSTDGFRGSTAPAPSTLSGGPLLSRVGVAGSLHTLGPATSSGYGVDVYGIGTYSNAAPLTVTQILPRGGRANWSLVANRVAFDHRNAAGWFQVYTCNPDGSGEISLTDGFDFGWTAVYGSSGHVRHVGLPSWSPDAQWIVFMVERAFNTSASLSDALVDHHSSQPGIGSKNDVWIMKADGSNKQLLHAFGTAGSMHCYFSPDGTRVAWSDMVGTAGSYADWQILVATATLTGTTWTLGTPAVHNPSSIANLAPSDGGHMNEINCWVTNDRIIVSGNPVNGQPETYDDIFLYDLSSQTIVLRYTQTSGQGQENPEYDEHGVISPVGGLVSWMSSSGNGPFGGGNDLWLVAADGSGIKSRLTSFVDPSSFMYVPPIGGATHVTAARPTWSADASQIIVPVYDGPNTDPAISSDGPIFLLNNVLGGLPAGNNVAGNVVLRGLAVTGALNVVSTGFSVSGGPVLHGPSIAGSLNASSPSFSVSGAIVLTDPANPPHFIRVSGSISRTGAIIAPSTKQPAVMVEVAFATNPTAPPIWTEITSDVRSFATQRGRQFELDRMQAGTASVLLDNQTRRYDPYNTASPYAPYVVPRRRIRINATWNGVTYPIYAGYVETWPQTWGLSGKQAESNVTAVDAFSLFGTAVINTTFNAEKSDVRVGHVLDLINWGSGQAGIVGDPIYGRIGTTMVIGPVGDRNIQPGAADLYGSSAVNVTALDHLLAVDKSENGLFFISRNGDVTFYGRQVQAATVWATFGDGFGELPYSDLEFSATPIWNDIRLTADNATGVEQAVSDGASQAAYFLSSKVESGYLQVSDFDLHGLAGWWLSNYKDPAQRISSMIVSPGRDPVNLWPAVLARELGDHVIVRRRPPGGGPVIAQESIIEGIEHNADPESWTVRFQLSPVLPTQQVQSFAIVGSAVVGTSLIGY